MVVTVMENKKLLAIIYATLAAAFYAISTPLSKLLIGQVSPTIMASFLYLGAGIGVGVMYVFHWKNEKKSERLTKNDLKYTIGMIVLDIIAPIFLMLGIKYGNASNASLLGNFEIVATTMIALLIFNEKVSNKLWAAIGFITLSSIILSLDSVQGFRFSYGSLFVLLATLCWGLENNCTRSISEKSTYEIVTLKGIGSGMGAFIVSYIIGEKLPETKYLFLVMLLGFVSYVLSIFTYIRAQKYLGAAKTSAYYAIAPFIGTAIAFIFLGEQITWKYIIALLIMIVGTAFVVTDTIIKSHTHIHNHVITHTHDGNTHTHTIEHCHKHRHIGDEQNHNHKVMTDYINSKEHYMDHLNL